MAYEVDQADMRAQVDEYVARSKGQMRWTMVAVTGVFFVVMTIQSLLSTNPYSPGAMLIIPVVGWLITLLLQVLAATSGPGEALDVQDEARARSVRRWRTASLVGAIGVWLPTAIISFFVWSQDMLASGWPYFFVWVVEGLLTSAMMMLADTKRMERNYRRQAVRIVLADQMLDQLDSASLEKPKRKRQNQVPLVGDDGELIVPDSDEHMANTHNQ